MSVKIKLMRMGKIRAPYYRIVVADARTKRDGRAIEEIGIYHPKEEPSRIEVKSDRVQHWLSVGAQPSEPVRAILSKTGDWQKFKGLPAPTEPLKVAPARADRTAIYEAEAQAAAGVSAPEAKPAKAAKKAAPKADEKAAPKADEKAAPKAEDKSAPKADEQSAPKADEAPAEEPSSAGADAAG